MRSCEASLHKTRYHNVTCCKTVPVSFPGLDVCTWCLHVLVPVESLQERQFPPTAEWGWSERQSHFDVGTCDGIATIHPSLGVNGGDCCSFPLTLVGRSLTPLFSYKHTQKLRSVPQKQTCPGIHSIVFYPLVQEKINALFNWKAQLM